MIETRRQGISVWFDDFMWAVEQSYFTTDSLPPIRSSWRQAPWDARPVFFPTEHIWSCPYETSSLRGGLVCLLQLLLVLASAVILRSESRRTHDHVLVSLIWDSPNLEGQVPVFISPRNWVAQLYPPTLGSLFVASYDSQSCDGVIIISSRILPKQKESGNKSRKLYSIIVRSL
jgi:hypothetical protein